MESYNYIKLFEEYFSSELRMGVSVEREHEGMYRKLKAHFEKYNELPPKKDVFKWIAEDHLKEFKDYYTLLKKMEKEAKLQK